MIGGYTDMFYDLGVQSELRSLESFVNFNSFLGSIDIATEGISFSSDTWKAFKEKVSTFFKHLWRSIKNFFISLFSNSNELMLNINVMENLFKTIVKWENRIVSGTHKLFKSAIDHNNTIESLNDVMDVFSDIDAEQKVLVTQSDAICGGSKKAYSYKLYRRNEIEEVNSFTKNMEELVNATIRYADDNTRVDNGETIRGMSTNVIIRITQILTSVNTAICTILLNARYDNRAKAGNAQFGKSITVTDIH